MLNILKDPKKIDFSTVWIPISVKVKTGVIYLFYFIMPVSVTRYSIIMDVALVIEATE